MNNKPSLARVLLVPVSVLAVLALAASLFGWFSVERIRQAQIRFLDEAVPLLESAREITFQLVAIESLVPQLVTHQSEKSLADSANVLQLSMASLGDALRDPQIVSRFEGAPRYISKISGELNELIQSVSNRITLDSTIDRDLLRMLTLTQGITEALRPISIGNNDLALDVTDNLFADIKQGQMDAALIQLDRLVELNLQLELIVKLTGNAESLLTLFEGLLQLDGGAIAEREHKQVEFILRSMVNDALDLEDTTASAPILALLDALFEAITAADNVFSMLSSRAMTNANLAKGNAELLRNVQALNGQISQLIQSLELIAHNATENVRSVTRWGAFVLIGIVIGLLLVSAIIAWRRIYRGTVVPINQLTEVVDATSQSDHSVPISDYPIAELSRMSKALVVFRANAVALGENERLLAKQNDILRQVNSDLNTFVRVASHDLKSPLRGLRILANLIEEDIKDERYEEVNTHLKTLVGRVNRMDRLLDSLLRYTKLSNKNTVVSAVQTKALIENAMHLFALREHFELVFETQLPVIRTTEALLEMVFRNLLDNALKYHDKEKGVIRVAHRDIGDYIEFSVSDDGAGIEPVYHERIFEVFQTLQPRDHVEGSGMGLSEVKKVIEQLGGSIRVESDAPRERGCTFMFTWPKQFPTVA